MKFKPIDTYGIKLHKQQQHVYAYHPVILRPKGSNPKHNICAFSI